MERDEADGVSSSTEVRDLVVAWAAFGEVVAAVVTGSAGTTVPGATGATAAAGATGEATSATSGAADVSTTTAAVRIPITVLASASRRALIELWSRAWRPDCVMPGHRSVRACSLARVRAITRRRDPRRSAQHHHLRAQ